MKRKIFLSMVISYLFAYAAVAQSTANTSYGTGAGTGGSATNGNAFFGGSAGRVTTGVGNAFLGTNAGYFNTTGSYNVFSGGASGWFNTTGSNNVNIGNGAAYFNSTGSNNTAIGSGALWSNTSSNNTALGNGAGYNALGSGNLFLGSNAGANETGSNKLYIANSGTTSPLLFGDFSSVRLAVGSNSPTETLDVNGTARIRSITQNNALNQILATDANGKVFWRDAASFISANGDNLGNHTATQNILPNATNLYSLGSGTNAFKDLFLGGNLNLTSVTQDNTQNKVLAADGTGKVVWRDAASFSCGTCTGGDNLGNHIATQSILPNTTDVYNLGSSTSMFKDIYLSGNLNLTNLTLNYSTNRIVAQDNNGKVVWKDLNVSTHGGWVSGTNVTLGYNMGNALTNTNGNLNSYNTAIGFQHLYQITNGSYNTAVGIWSLISNTTGNYNTAIGSWLLQNNTTGGYNIALGHDALNNNTLGSNNIAIGYSSGPNSGNYNNTLALGYLARTSASNQVRIGNSNVTSIGGQVSWSTLSDGRFKKDVKEDVSGIDFINLLRPVSYTIDRNKFDAFLGIPDSLRQSDPSARTEVIRQTGFVAQEVEEVIKKTGYVFHGVEVPKNENDHYGIRYAEFVVPLTKAVQELSAQVDKQQRTIDALKKVIQQKDSKELDALDELEVFQNNPNPFQQDTEIRMNIPKSIQNATLFIYDLNGKQIEKQILSGRGQVIAKVEGGHLSPGIYLYTLIADGHAAATKRMILTD